MKKIQLLTCLTLTTLLLTSCSFFMSYNVNEENARKVLNNIINKQSSPDFVYPLKARVFKTYNSRLQTISFGNTVSERDKYELTLEMDLNNGYFHYLFKDLLTPMLNEERYFFLDNGDLYLTKEDEQGKFYNAYDGLTGKEVNDMILSFANKYNFYAYLLGVNEQREGTRLLDYYSNGLDAYRDSLQVGSVVNIFNFSFASKSDDNLSLEETLKSSLSYSEKLNHGENNNYSFININFDNDLLINASKQESFIRSYYYEDTLIESYELDRNIEIANSSLVSLTKVDLTNFVLDVELGVSNE